MGVIGDTLWGIVWDLTGIMVWITPNRWGLIRGIGIINVIFLFDPD